MIGNLKKNLIKRFKKKLQKIFKYISYNLFFLLYGKIRKVITLKEDQRIDLKKITFEDEKFYNIYTIRQARLYTDTIHDTAVILDNNIVEGPSFQLRNNNNSKCNENIVFTKGTPRLQKKINGTVFSLLTGGGGNNNYWHWLFDVLPRLAILKNSIKSEKIDYFLFPNYEEKFQVESLEILKIPLNKIISSKHYRHINTKKLITVDHPYVFKNAHLDAQHIPKWIFNWLKKSFLKDDSINSKDFPSKIYIDRKDSKSNHRNFRLIKNELEVRNLLESKGFKSLCISDFHFSDQIKIFNTATHIVGLHGSGFGNLVFSKPDTRVVEFKTETTGEIIGNLAVNNKLKYNSIIGTTSETKAVVQQGIINIPIDLLEKKLNNIMA